MDAYEYLRLPLSERQNHMDLAQECYIRGGTSQHHKGVLAQYLDTPIFNKPCDLCHGCHNGNCSNPRHLYWGTRSENVQDSIRNGTYRNRWDVIKDKLGEQVAREMFRQKSIEHHQKRKEKGIESPHKGTIYINNGVTSKRIGKDEPIPEGWTRGRIKFR